MKCQQCKEIKRYYLSSDNLWICFDCYEYNRKIKNKLDQTKLFKEL